MRHIWKPVPQGCCLLRQEKPQIRLKRDLETNEILLRQNYYLMKIIKVCRISREIIQKGDVFIVFLRSYRDTFLICSVLLLFLCEGYQELNFHSGIWNGTKKIKKSPRTKKTFSFHFLLAFQPLQRRKTKMNS